MSPTWTYFTAFPIDFLWVVTRILLGAGDLLTVLDTVPASAEDAGQEAVEPEDRVPHFPVGVGLPVVNTSWRKERKELPVEINPPPLCTPKVWWSSTHFATLETGVPAVLRNMVLWQQGTQGYCSQPTKEVPWGRRTRSSRWTLLESTTQIGASGKCGQDLTCLQVSASPGSLRGCHRHEAQ